jgi:UDPglucose 6-dehydrogenase
LAPSIGRRPERLKVGIVGTGHVGLPTAAVLAHIGHHVTAIDSDAEKLERLNAGVMPFYEPGMEELVTTEVAAGRLVFSGDVGHVVEDAGVVFLCVGTPPRASGEANLLAVERAGQQVAEYADHDLVLVEKSTVPAGTAQRLSRALDRYRPGVKIPIASNPEFLREGSAIEDSLKPDRILVGSDSPAALRTMKDLYEPMIRDGAEWVETDLATAELAKHACNAFLAMKISFANAMARLCELAGADVEKVTEAMGSDPRIGPAFLKAGIGYGGYCFPKDLAAFENLAGRLGYDFGLLREVAKINDEAVEAALRKIEDALWNLEEKRVAVLGLSFKAGTDDIRLSPSLRLVRLLIDRGAHVVGFDPRAGERAKAEIPEMELADGLYTALEGAHCAVIATEWPEFSEIDLARANETMRFPILVDGRNMLEPAAAAAAGLTYIPTGRPAVGHEVEKRE